MTASIHDFPPEVLDIVLAFCDPVDVSSFAQTSRLHRSLVYDAADQHLWRSLYLAQPLDDPRKCVDPLLRPINEEKFDWKRELQTIIRAETIVLNPDACRTGEAPAIFQTLIALGSRYPRLSTGGDFRDNLSCNLLWVAAILRGGSFLSDPRWAELPPQDAALRARLHTMYGLTQRDLAHSRRADSRAYVYDMRRYTRENRFGPFVRDGSCTVDWELMCALHHVLSMHVVDISEDSDEAETYTIFPMSLPFCQPVLQNGQEADRRDWAGVTGKWRVSFAYCDHRELLVFNNFNSPDDPPNKAIFEDPNFDEAYHTLTVDMFIKSFEPDPKHPDYPKINFGGQLSNAGASSMTGYVEMTHEEHIRWHFVSGDAGQAIWSSEGVQVGGVQSPFGVLGIWTTVFHDEHDPVGPFWLSRAPLMVTSI